MDISHNTLAMISLDDVHLNLVSAAGPVNILRGITLSIGHGETVSLVGPSGSGKTTLMMLIAGLERQTSGKILVNGGDLEALDENGLALLRRDAVGIVFQDFHLVGAMNALENVAMPLEFAGVADAFDRARDALDAVGLGPRVGHYPGQLSGGEQQRVAIARAFVANPKLLLADEPTGNLDGATGGAVMDLLFEMQARSGATLILITHSMDIAARCARHLQIADGKIISDTEST
ncbi:MAG: ATP-binding cassette domain-containing protein [Pseudomonadota bacterium]|nr:ATP-binding cassette domain-containing protein [Pseudomonadota bacterium]